MQTHERPADTDSRPRVDGNADGVRPEPAARASRPAVPGVDSALSRRAWLTGFASILALAALLRLPALDTPVGGFHAFNEAHYIPHRAKRAARLDPAPD